MVGRDLELSAPPLERAGASRLTRLALLAAGPLLVLGVFFVLPVSGMISRGFVVDGSFDPGGVLEVLGRSRVRSVVWFTLWSAAAGTAMSLLLGLPAAYALHRLELPGRRIVRSVLLVPFALPTVVVGVAFRQLLGDSGPLGWLGLDGSAIAIIAGLTFFNAAVVVRAVGAAWEGLDPRPGEAAAALGATPLQVLRTVTFPALKPALVSATTVVFLFCATAFGVVLTLGGLKYSTVETEIYLLTTNLLDLQAAAALSVLQLVVIIALLALAQRARATPDPTQQRVLARPRRVRRADAGVLVVTGSLLGFVLVPLLTLVTGSLRVEGGGWGLANYRALATAGRDTDGTGVLNVSVTEALVNSLRIAFDATWMSLSMGVLVAMVVTRRSRTRSEHRLRSGLDAIFMLPLGVSAVTLGFGFLITLDSPPLDLRDSPLLVPIAQALVALPLVVRTLAPVLASIDDRQRQAAASLGAGPLRALLTVDLPVVRTPLLAAGGFAFAVSLGEFGATSFLAREDRPTLPIVIFRLLGHPGALNYQMALAASVVLAATTALVILAVEQLRVTSVGAF